MEVVCSFLAFFALPLSVVDCGLVVVDRDVSPLLQQWYNNWSLWVNELPTPKPCYVLLSETHKTPLPYANAPKNQTRLASLPPGDPRLYKKEFKRVHGPWYVSAAPSTCSSQAVGREEGQANPMTDRSEIKKIPID